MKRHQNLILLLAVVLLTIVPLWLVHPPAPDVNGEVTEIFAGADDQARDLVGQINPDYEPWFAPLIEPASGEIASLLFALQAALGAGFIGYYLGVSVTREKMRRELEKTGAENSAKSDARNDAKAGARSDAKGTRAD